MITYLKGDATYPIGEGHKVIAHIVNNANQWEAGFVLALNKRWNAPKYFYHKFRGHRVLGENQYLNVEFDITIVNMCAQDNLSDSKIIPPIRYDALIKCLVQLNNYLVSNNDTLHCPKFGAGIAGGDWEIIERLINKYITVDVFVYELE